MKTRFFLGSVLLLLASVRIASAGEEVLQTGSERVERGPTPSEEGIFSRRYLHRIAQDTEALATAPLRWRSDEWGAALLILGTTAGGIATDRTTQRYFQNHRNEMTDRIAGEVRGLGAEKGLGLLGAFYLTGALFKNGEAYAVAADGFEASVIGALFSSGLKIAVGRSRPNAGEGSDDFHPFRLSLSFNEHARGHSFPSGHATEAFVIASVVTGHYDSIPVGVASYGLAGMVALSRVNDNAHFLSDVFFGGVLGAWIGKEVVALNAPKEGGAPRSALFVPRLARGYSGGELIFAF